MSVKQIKQPNILVESSYYLSIAQKLLMLHVLSKVDTFSDIPERDFIHIDLKKLHSDSKQVISRKDFYKKMRNGVSKLQGLQFRLPDTSEYKNRYEHWIQSRADTSQNTVIAIRLSSALAKLMTELNKEYTLVDYRSSMMLRSNHAIRIYELLKQWSNTKTLIQFEVNELREKLGLQDKYKDIAKFKAEVVQPAINQINQFTDLSVDLTQKKCGREVTHYIFKVIDHYKKIETSSGQTGSTNQSSRVTNENLVPANKLMENALAKQGYQY